MGYVMAQEIPQVFPQVLPDAKRKGRPPRPRHLGRKVGHAAKPACPDRSVCALFDGTSFEDDGVPCGGCQSRRPLSEPNLSESGFQLFACCPHRLPFIGGDACITRNSTASRWPPCG